MENQIPRDARATLSAELKHPKPRCESCGVFCCLSQFPVGASLLAAVSAGPRFFRRRASSLTSIVSKLVIFSA